MKHSRYQLAVAAALVVAQAGCGGAAHPGPSPGPNLVPSSVIPRKLVVHGPFSVDFSSLAAGGSGKAGNCALPRAVAASTGVPAQTPGAAFGFTESAGLNGVDPGVAAGSSFLLVADDSNGVAIYDKGGILLGQEPGATPLAANPFTAKSLFAAAAADIATKLTFPPMASLPAGFANPASPNFGAGIAGYGDVRVMFDAYRKRFWIYAMAKTPGVAAANLIVFPALKLTRRDKAVVAVSKTEDPRDGFYTYWWDETVANGTCNQFTPCGDPQFGISGEGADYPSIAIAPKYLVATIGVNRRDPTFDTLTPAQAAAWASCETGFVAHGDTFSTCGPFYSRVMVVDANELAAGCPGGKPAGCADGRSFNVFVDAGNFITDRTESHEFANGMARGLKPVMMHGPAWTDPASRADAYLVNNFLDRTAERSLLTVWRLVDDGLIPSTYPIQLFTYNNDYNLVISATYRNGSVYAAFHDCWPGDTTCGGTSAMAIRLVQVNYDPASGGSSAGVVARDRNFGGANAFEDPPGSEFRYTYPGIEVSAGGDVVAVYARYGAPLAGRRQDVRYSTWIHGEPDIRPSHLLKAGEIQSAVSTDTAGIAVDPAAEDVIWVAHVFANQDNTGGSCNQIAVGKIDLSTRLTVVVKNVTTGTEQPITIPPWLALTVDGTVQASGVSGGFGPVVLGPGNHVVSQGTIDTFPLGVQTTIGGDCGPDGSFAFSASGPKTCVITNHFPPGTVCANQCKLDRDDCLKLPADPKNPLPGECAKSYTGCLGQCK